MRALAVCALLLLCLAGAAAASSDRSPRLPKLGPTAADKKFASASLLRLSDLTNVVPGWTVLATEPDDSAPICPWQDYSALTLTAHAEHDFQPKKVSTEGFLGSSVDMFGSHEEALTKFTIDIHPGTVACEGEALRKAFGATVKLLSGHQLAEPGLGERAVAFEFVYLPGGTLGKKKLYVHLIEFVRGRGVAVLLATTFGSPGDVRGRQSLAHLMDTRLS